MARDLYRTFYAQGKNDIFANIAGSEQRPMDAVLRLLTLYGITDQAAGLSEGQFSNIDVQALYDSLLEQGMASGVAALEAAQELEETDLADLDRAISGTGIARSCASIAICSRAHRITCGVYQPPVSARCRCDRQQCQTW